MTPADLIAFEDEMAELFASGKIKAPLHLSGGNEEQLIEIFKSMKPDDWVLGTWRAHFHALLKGVPREEVREAILAGRSIALTFPKYRVLCSAIVGGIAPIAVGLAWAIKRQGGKERVWCFLGDMAVECGIVHESMKYAYGYDLPVNWCIEDNAIGGTNVPTQELWPIRSGIDAFFDPEASEYDYEMTRPFVGVGHHIPL